MKKEDEFPHEYSYPTFSHPQLCPFHVVGKDIKLCLFHEVGKDIQLCLFHEVGVELQLLSIQSNKYDFHQHPLHIYLINLIKISRK